MIPKGKLTYVSGAAALFAGIADLLNCAVGMFSGTPCDPTNAIGTIATGLGLIGLRRAL